MSDYDAFDNFLQTNWSTEEEVEERFQEFDLGHEHKGYWHEENEIIQVRKKKGQQYLIERTLEPHYPEFKYCPY